MEGHVLMTHGNQPPHPLSSETTGQQRQIMHHRHHHPELEHLAKTMPSATPVTFTGGDSDVRSQSRMSISHDKGLLNMPGQNNCFLNSAVQVLWHLDVFRRSFRELHGHACMGDSCIFCALKELFNQFQSSTESALPPDSLRFALAQSFSDQRRFRLGCMDDAAECFENILFRIHYHITNKEPVADSKSPTSSTKCQPHCIPHQKFAMNLYEQIVCFSCGATSDPFTFSQMVHYTSTSALCSVQQQLANETTDDKAKFGDLLKKASSVGDIRNCPKMCGAMVNIKKVLLNRPDVISVGLVWDTDHPSLITIRKVYHLIETTIRLNEIFDVNDGTEQDKELNLVGLVTYYGKHYSTYIFNTKLSQWIYFDDANVRVVGPYWQQVVDKCVKGHFQPLLLLYSNPRASIISTEYASKEIIPLAIKKPVPADIKPEPFCQPNGYGCEYSAKTYSDVPDSPSATSTTSYFSDLGDSTDGYISRKTVESIIKIQRSSKRQMNSDRKLNVLNNYNRKYNRNSSSSLESFDSVVRQTNNISKFVVQEPPTTTCSLQRRDSGNSNSDRASSVSSNETPYHPQQRLVKGSNRNPGKNASDQGYDSFSLSSSDSYPSAATSPSKLNSKLKQIPEDVQLIDMVNNLSMKECDKLCSEADILLLRSHEKEREGDLRAAAALSDSAAAKARLAMDIPYSNHQTLISAKMKHSMCVMRSASLHKRVLEMETEEKRLLKALESSHHHSRQSSRDSTHGRHSRQNSRDGKDPKSAKETKAQQPEKVANLEIYATLPKKSKRRPALAKEQNGLPGDIVNGVSTDDDRKIYENVSTFLASGKPSSNLKNKNNKVSDSEFSDYYSEWEGFKTKMAPSKKLNSTTNGWQSCRENDSESYAELGTFQKPIKKQCKVKRKLMLGSLLKTKNRSLPDLREEALKNPKPKAEDVGASPNKCTVAQINAKGFHQSHRSFVAEHGFKSKPLLIKVKPPLLEVPEKPVQRDSLRPSPVPVLTCVPPDDVDCGKNDNLPASPTRNVFLEELNKKRNEILKKKSLPVPPTIASNPVMGKKPSLFEIANFISKNVPNGGQHSNNKFQLEPAIKPDRTAIHMPIPVNALDGKPLRLPINKPPDYETTIKRIEMNQIENHLQKKSRIRTFATPSPPIYSNMANMKSGTLEKSMESTTGDATKSINKKSVKFSDQIELVECIDDEPDEPLPNLLLEKVLTGKNLVYTLQQ